MARPFHQVTKDLLDMLADMGDILVAVSTGSRGRLTEISLLTRNERKALHNEREYWNALRRLKKSRLIIEREKPDGTIVVSLNEHGKRKVREFRFWDLTIPKPKKWDGRYRLVIFDIPKTYGKVRNIFTRKLKTIGLYPLQKSVWIFPYPCAAEIEFLAEYIGLTKHVHIIEATSISNDVAIKRHFRLFA